MTSHEPTPRFLHGTRRAAPVLARALLAAALALSPALGRAADEDKLDYLEEWSERDRGTGWNISPALNGGYTQLIKGYEDYTNLGNAGIDLYMRPPVPQFPKWHSRMMFRLSVDYFPLQVPDDVVGITHDLYSLNGTVLWRFMDMSQAEHHQWVPFVGGGVGMYLDRITLEMPASGKISGTKRYLGGTASVGVQIPCIGSIRLVPELRYHAILEPDNFWAQHVTYQLGAALWFPAKVKEQ